MFDAIEHKYLKAMSLIITNASETDGEASAPTDDVIEAYTLKYEYAEDGTCYMDTTGGEGPPLPCSKENALSQAKQMIRTLAVFNESLPGLPDGRTIVIKLKYHDVTPDDYEPTYFKSSTAEAYSS